MAKPTSFNAKPKKQAGSTSFNFGFNALPKAKGSKAAKKSGKGGGS